MINSILELFKKPITHTNEEAETAELKGSFIKAGIISAVFFICNFIACFLNEITINKYDYDKHEFVTKYGFDNFKFEDVITPAITNFIIVFIALIVITTVMYVITRILKNDNSFAKLLQISVNAFIPVACATIISLFTSWFYAPIGIIAYVIGSMYALFILIYAFRNTLNIENEDKLTLIYIAIITGIFIILYFLATSIFEDMLLDLF